MAGAVQDSGTFRGIARTLLALALLAERAAGRSLPVRFLVLVILGQAEAIARRFVARAAATLIAEAIEAGCPHLPDLACLDLACLDELHETHYSATDAVLLALRLRILAAVLGALADAEDILDERSAGWGAEGSAGGTLRSGVVNNLPLLLVVRFPAIRRLVRPSRPP